MLGGRHHGLEVEGVDLLKFCPEGVGDQAVLLHQTQPDELVRLHYYVEHCVVAACFSPCLLEYCPMVMSSTRR